MIEIPDEQLERAAYILGDRSGAAMALVNLHERRERGEDAVAFLTRGSYIVGPRVESEMQP